MATATKKQADICEDHQTPICTECGYCINDPEHLKHLDGPTLYGRRSKSLAYGEIELTTAINRELFRRYQESKKSRAID